MILVISTPTDDHALAVLAELEHLGAPATLLDLSWFPQRTQLTMHYDGNQERDFALQLEGQGALPLACCRVAWWRRPQPFELHPAITQPSYRQFIQHESFEAFAGLWQALDAFWVNHPTRDDVASHKSYQLRIAQECGLTIPATLITNNPAEARAFIAAQGIERTVYKSFLATEEAWRETRVLQNDEISLLESVRYAPVIFQEYIPATLDLRITVVGDQIFPSAIHSQETDYKVDYRMNLGQARIETYRLPPEVGEKLRAFMDRLGLIYGAIDMRLTPDGNYVFLEVNTAGQWLFMEEPTGQPITAAMAGLLAAHDR